MTPGYRRRMGQRFVATAVLLVALALPAAASATSQAIATGTGGAAASVDRDATQTAINILSKGGNAIDAAVAANATLGVTEPYVAGIGGGGVMTIYLAGQHRLITIDGREKGPQGVQEGAAVVPGARLHPPEHRPADPVLATTRHQRHGGWGPWDAPAVGTGAEPL